MYTCMVGTRTTQRNTKDVMMVAVGDYFSCHLVDERITHLMVQNVGSLRRTTCSSPQTVEATMRHISRRGTESVQWVRLHTAVDLFTDISCITVEKTHGSNTSNMPECHNVHKLMGQGVMFELAT